MTEWYNTTQHNIGIIKQYFNMHTASYNGIYKIKISYNSLDKTSSNSACMYVWVTNVTKRYTLEIYWYAYSYIHNNAYLKYSLHMRIQHAWIHTWTDSTRVICWRHKIFYHISSILINITYLRTIDVFTSFEQQIAM